MATIFQIAGLYQVVLNLRRVSPNMAAGVALGLREAGLLLQRESQRLVPVEFGNLRASSFIRARGTGFQTEVFVGYTALYAFMVHEKVGMKLRGQLRKPSPPHIGRYWDPQRQAQAKFLEAPARRLEPQLVRIIANRARLTP